MTGGRLALFADCLLLGVFTALAAIPVVTAYPAFVAACTMLRDETPVGPVTFLRQLLAVLRSDILLWCAPPVALMLVALDTMAVVAGVPGAKPFTVFLVIATAAAIVLALRAAAQWHPARRWRSLLPAIVHEAARDLSGSALLLLAALTAATIVVLVPVSALLVAGPLALASVAVSRAMNRAVNRRATVAVKEVGRG